MSKLNLKSVSLRKSEALRKTHATLKSYMVLQLHIVPFCCFSLLEINVTYILDY